MKQAFLQAVGNVLAAMDTVRLVTTIRKKAVNRVILCSYIRVVHQSSIEKFLLEVFEDNRDLLRTSLKETVRKQLKEKRGDAEIDDGELTSIIDACVRERGMSIGLDLLAEVRPNSYPRVLWSMLTVALLNAVSGKIVGASRTKASEYEIEPPRLAEFLVGLFAKKRYRNGLLQNLDEEFRDKLAAGISPRRAQMLYWAAAINSIGPQLWAAIKRVGVIGMVADYIRGRLGGA